MPRVSDVAYNMENYKTSVLASSIGLNEAIGVAGLVTLGIKGAVNAVALARLKSQAKDESLPAEKRQKIEGRIQKLKETRHQDAKTAKAMSMLLVPVVGGIMARRLGDLTGAYASAVTEVIGIAGAKDMAKSMAKNGAYPLSGGKYDFAEAENPGMHEFYQQQNLQRERPAMHSMLSNGANRIEELKINTQDGRQISATYAQGVDASGNPVSENGPTAILFHGNGMVKEGMAPIAKFYQERGINVLLITMGGYGDSAPGTETTELSTYHDAQAAVNYLRRAKNLGNKQILAHGISMGGSLAAFVGKNNPGAHVVADQTFGSFRDCSVNTVINTICKNMLRGVNPTKPFKDFKNAVFEGAVRQYFPKDIHDRHGLRDAKGKIVQTDALDNAKKIRKVKGSFFAIKSSKDHLMGWDPNKQGINEVNFADKLVDEYYAHQHKTNPNCRAKKEMIVEIEGGHSISFTEHPEAVNKLEQHLRDLHFMPLLQAV